MSPLKSGYCLGLVQVRPECYLDVRRRQRESDTCSDAQPCWEPEEMYLEKMILIWITCSRRIPGLWRMYKRPFWCAITHNNNKNNNSGSPRNIRKVLPSRFVLACLKFSYWKVYMIHLYSILRTIALLTWSSQTSILPTLHHKLQSSSFISVTKML